MKAEAIKKINDELESNKNTVISRIGEFIKNHVEICPDDAVKVLALDKNLKGAFGAMKDEARKNQVDGCGGMSDEEGYALVLKYFGIDTSFTPGTQEQQKQTEAPKAHTGALELSLDDLL